MTIASRNQSSHYQEAKSNLQSLVKQTCQVGLGFAVMLLVTAGRPSAFGLSVTVCLGIGFVAWSEVRRLDSSNFSIDEETQRENIKTYYGRSYYRGYSDYVLDGSPLYSKKKKSSKENSWNEELLDSPVQKIQISGKVIEQTAVIFPVCYTKENTFLFATTYQVKKGYFYQIYIKGILSIKSEEIFIEITEESKINTEELERLTKRLVEIYIALHPIAGVANSAIKVIDAKYEKIS